MIHDQDLSMFLWEKAFNIEIYIQNRYPHMILEDKTPEKEFPGVKPEVTHLCILVLQFISIYM